MLPFDAAGDPCRILFAVKDDVAAEEFMYPFVWQVCEDADGPECPAPPLGTTIEDAMGGITFIGVRPGRRERCPTRPARPLFVAGGSRPTTVLGALPGGSQPIPSPTVPALWALGPRADHRGRDLVEGGTWVLDLHQSCPYLDPSAPVTINPSAINIGQYAGCTAQGILEGVALTPDCGA